MPEFDPDAFLKERSQPAVSRNGGAQAFDPDAFIKERELPSFSRGADVGTGLARGVVGEAAAATDLVRMLPQVKAVEKVVRSIPGADDLAKRGRQLVRDFTDRPDRSNWEKGGRWAGMVLPYMLQPELGLEGLAARAAGMLPKIGSKVAPVVRGAAGKWIANPAYVAQRAKVAKFSKWGATAGRGAERAAVGAEAGAIQNPDDPGRGAMFGAAGGLAPAVLGRAMRSRIGQAAGGHMARAGASAATHAAVSPFLGPGISIASSIAPWTRAGAPVHRAGALVMDTAGRIVGFVPAAAGGVAAGAASGKNRDTRSAPSE